VQGRRGEREEQRGRKERKIKVGEGRGGEKRERKGREGEEEREGEGDTHHTNPSLLPALLHHCVM